MFSYGLFLICQMKTILLKIRTIGHHDKHETFVTQVQKRIFLLYKIIVDLKKRFLSDKFTRIKDWGSPEDYLPVICIDSV